MGNISRHDVIMCVSKKHAADYMATIKSNYRSEEKYSNIISVSLGDNHSADILDWIRFSSSFDKHVLRDPLLLEKIRARSIST